METPPTTLQGWKEAAFRFDGNWRRAQAIAQRIKGITTRSYESTFAAQAKELTPTRDPNAMDVDRLTQQERMEHIKKGLCFICHEPGHLSSTCKKKGDKSQPRRNFGRFKKGTPAQRIRAILDDEMKDDEKEEIANMFENEGF